MTKTFTKTIFGLYYDCSEYIDYYYRNKYTYTPSFNNRCVGFRFILKRK